MQNMVFSFGGDFMGEFHFKKKYGQNFLTDTNLVKKIVSIANISDSSLVLEVGPGRAILTRELLNVSRQVLSYEIDLELKEFLDHFKKDYSNIEFIFDDFLKRDIIKDIQNYSYQSIYFVSNVPYYITTPILMKLIHSKIDFTKIVMMVQEEVGERFSARLGSKNYSSITVILHYFYEIKKELKVSRKMFTPIPNVDSLVISFTKRSKRLDLKNEELFFRLVRDSFQYKRKNIRNNLRNYPLELIEEILKRNQLSLMDRAENIPVEVFVEIANYLS